MSGNDISNVITFRPRKFPKMPAVHQGMERISLTMLYALTEYAANKLEIGQKTVQAMVVAALGMRCFEQMQKDDFERASKYIVNLLDDHTVRH
jgi:hypothetical protein